MKKLYKKWRFQSHLTEYGAKVVFPMDRKAFSMIELIFVIVIISILATAAVMLMPDNRLYSDTNFVIQQIKQKQNNGLLYDHLDFSDTSWRTKEYNDTCIKLDKNSFISINKQNYKLSSQTKLNASEEKICFDNLGRPYKNNYLLNNFLNQPIELNITYKKKVRKIDILPYSGLVMIKK